MNRKQRTWAVAILSVLVIVALAVAGCNDKDQFLARGVTNFDELHLSGNSATATPVLLVNQAGAGKVFEVQDAGTPVFSVNDGGAVAQTGDLSLTGNLVVAGPTVAATATPMVYANTAADAPDLWVIAKDATPVAYVHNSGELYVVGDAKIGDTLNVDGDIDLDGDGFDVNISAGFSIDADAASNINTNTGDLTIENEDKSIIIKGDEAAADAVYLDADDVAGTGVTVAVGSTGGFNVGGGCLNVGGGTPASCGDDDAYVTADLEVDDTLDVDGDIDLDGDGFDVDITAGFSIDGDAASNVSVAGAGIDLTLASAAGRIVIQASEATADAVYIDADGNAASGLDIDVGATNGVSIDGGLTDFGSGTYTLADADNDVGIDGDLEVNTNVLVNGALALDQTNVAGASANPFDYTATAGIMDGSDTLVIIDINLTNADHTSTGNVVTAIDIAGIVGDADATETAILVGAGWDLGLDLSGTPIDLDVDGDTSITASTDDQIDIEISGADDFQFTANTFTLLAGSKIAHSAVTTGTHGVVFVCSGTHGHASAEAAVSMCSLPANANVVDVTYAVTTQWNDGSSAAVNCGIRGGDTDAFVDNMNINDAADVNRMGDDTDMVFGSAFIDVGATAVDVICQVAEGTDNASAGAATLILWYMID